MQRILVVEDELDLQDTVAYALRREGYHVLLADTARAAITLARAAPGIDLVLLDLMLPDRSGTEVCRALRSDPQTQRVPIIMVSARDEEVDRVVGFEVGADDYVTKPFSVRELLLRVRALLRRVQPQAAPDEASEIVIGRLQVNPAGYQVRVDDEPVDLTALEFRLLTTLLGRRGRVQTRETLLNDVWGYQGDVTTRTVDTHIKRLRQKLGAAGEYIETARGVGYRFRATPDEPST